MQTLMAMTPRFAVVLFFAAVSGCVVSRVDPETPELPLPAALASPNAALTALPDPWWGVFGDDTLNALMDEALANNAEVAIAAARVEQARAQLRITNGERWPWLDLQAGATRAKDSAAITQFPGVDQHRTTYTVQGAVSFELDLWGRLQRASESARAQLLNTEFGREATKLSLTGEVARNYFGLIAAAEQLGRARETLESREESRRLEQLRFDAGETDEFTLKRAQAEAAATRVSVHQLERSVVELANALGVLLGRSPKDLVDNAIRVAGVNLPDARLLPADVPSAVLARRPDIAASEAALVSAAADIGAARAALFPTISLTGAFGSISPELSDLFTTPTEAWSATGGLLQPIFQGGRLRANVTRTQALRQQRQAEYANAVRTAFREVLDALQGQELIVGVRTASEEQVDALARAAELANLRYTQGDLAYLELLDVRRSLFQAEVDLVAARRDALLNTVDLALALGGGLGAHASTMSARR